MVRELLLLLLLRLVGWQTANMQHIHPAPNTQHPTPTYQLCLNPGSRSRCRPRSGRTLYSNSFSLLFLTMISFFHISYPGGRVLPLEGRREEGGGRRVLYLIVRSTFYVGTSNAGSVASFHCMTHGRSARQNRAFFSALWPPGCLV